MGRVPTFGKTLGETALSGSKLENPQTKNTTCVGCSQAKDVLTFSDMILLHVFRAHSDHKTLGSPVLGLSSQSHSSFCNKLVIGSEREPLHSTVPPVMGAESGKECP